MPIVERADLTNLNLSSGTAGSGNLIHPDFAQEIIKAAVESSIALRRFSVRRVPTGQMSIPVLSSLPAAYWVAETPLTGVSAPASRKGTTEPGWSGVVLKLAELAAIVPIPLAIIEDAAGGGYDLWTEIRPLVGQAIAMKVDEATFFGGTGAHTQPTGWFGGLVTQAVAAGKTHAIGADTASALAAANAALLDVENTGYSPSYWTANNAFRGKMRGLTGTDGHPVYLSSFRSQGQADELYGVPIDYANSGTKGGWDSTVALALVGDDSAVIMGVSTEGMRVDMLKEATIDVSGALDGSSTINLAQQNLVALRMSFRVAMVTAVPATVKGDGNVPFSVITP